MPRTQSTRSVQRRHHVLALDGLRGVAVLGVLLFHAGLLPGGFLGVDLFFVLSGYLITDLLLREVGGTGTVSPAAFWGRRVRRLLPALATVLVVVTDRSAERIHTCPRAPPGSPGGCSGSWGSGSPASPRPTRSRGPTPGGRPTSTSRAADGAVGRTAP